MSRQKSIFLTAAAGIFLLVVIAPSIALASTSQFANYVCGPTQIVLFDNSNGGLVANGGTPPTFSTNGKAYCLNGIETYHWNDGKGSKPGYLWLKRLSGPAGLPDRTSFFQALGSPGQNNVANANSYVYTPMKPPIIIDGTYQCVDTIRGTWSQDSASGGNGFCHITVMAAMPASAAVATPAKTTAATTPTKAAAAPSKGASGSGVAYTIAAVVVAGLAFTLFRMKSQIRTKIAPKPAPVQNTVYEGTGGAFHHDTYSGTPEQRYEQAQARLYEANPYPHAMSDSSFLSNESVIAEKPPTFTPTTEELPELGEESAPTDGEVM